MQPARGTLLLAFVLSGLACTPADPLNVGQCTRFVDEPDKCPGYCIGVDLVRGGKGESFNFSTKVDLTWTVEGDELVVKVSGNERRYKITEDGGLEGPDGWDHRYQRASCF